jgi:methyl-accepting chemotaxis protein
MEIHNQIQTLINQLRDYLGDAAQLMLDPELSSYYLIYLLVNDLPRLQERLGRLYASGYLSFTRLPVSEADRARMERSSLLWNDTMGAHIRNKINKACQAATDTEAASLKRDVDRYLESTRLFLEMGHAISMKSGTVAMDDYMRAGRTAMQAGADLWDHCNDLFQRLVDTRIRHLHLRAALGLGISLVSVIIFVLLAWTIVMSITRPLARVAQIAGRIAEGEVFSASQMLQTSCQSSHLTPGSLAQARTSGSEIVQLYAAMARMIQGLEELLGAVNASGDSIESSAQRIAASARQLEAAATQQAASTTEVGATSREISSTAGGLADTMAQVLEVASRSSELAQEGRHGLAQMGDVMEDLSQASHDMTTKLSDIREKTSGIGQFLSTIAKVATQTNLLSLNAAIEAEKAGEFGPGFSVVAREIRRLADQTASAALDIERTIREMQASVQTGVAAMDGFAAKAGEASQTTTAVASKLTRIIAAGEELTPRFSAASQSTRLQAEGADQISEVISQLAQGAGQTRDSLAEFRHAAEALTATASGLKEVLGYFKLRA